MQKHKSTLVMLEEPALEEFVNLLQILQTLLVFFQHPT